jgi:hypothetical protein
MTDLMHRERGFEAQFEHDLERRFRAITRRNKLLGLWAAEVMNLPAPEAEAYARDLVAADVSDTHRPDDLHDKVYADLHRHGVDLSDHRLRRKMDTLLVEAQRQILAEEEAAARHTAR